MFLAAFDLVGPGAVVGLLVVEQASVAGLLGGRAVPAGPVTRAGRGVAEGAVQPLAVVRRDGSVGEGLAVAGVGPPGVVTPVSYAAVVAQEHEAVWAVVELGVALVALPVPVAVVDVTDDAVARIARVRLLPPRPLALGGLLARGQTADGKSDTEG